MPKARRVLAALKGEGWVEVSCNGSHRKLVRNGITYIFAFHDGDEIGPVMMRRIARGTGLDVDRV